MNLRGFESHPFRKYKRKVKVLFMIYNKEVQLMHLKNRLNKLNMNPIENANLMRKVKRQINKLSAK